MKIPTWIWAVVGCFLLVPLKAGNESLWQVHTHNLHASYAPAPMASGCIGILPGKEPFRIEQVVLNHVFDAAAPGTVSRVMRGINPFGLNMKVDGETVDTTCIEGWNQTVDMRKAVHRTGFQIGRKAHVISDLRALRGLPYSGLISVQVEALTDITIEVRCGMECGAEWRFPMIIEKAKHITVSWMPTVPVCTYSKQKPFRHAERNKLRQHLPFY